MDIKNKLENALEYLQNRIWNVTGVQVTLHVSVGTNSEGEDYYRIESDDLSNTLSGIAKTLFQKIHITTWGGTVVKNGAGENFICFMPKVQYTHFGGGKNGTDFIWSVLYFNLDTGLWELEKSKTIGPWEHEIARMPYTYY